MNIIAIITARGGSKGIINKNVMDFCGKPLVAWSIIHAQKTNKINHIYVTTDDSKIAEISKQYGATVIDRPAELATDFATTEAAMLHVLSKIDYEPDLIVYLQPTSPVRWDYDIEKALDLFIAEGADSLFSASILDDFCAWKNVNNTLQSITYDYNNRGRRQERDNLYLENGSIYIYKPYILKKYNNRLGDKISIYKMPMWQSYEVDDLDGLEICKYYMKNKILNIGDTIDSFIIDKTSGILNKNKFPEYDDVHTDTFAELIDRLIISHIRYWYLEDAMANASSNEELVMLRKKSEIIFKEKRPMLIKALDKLILNILKNKHSYNAENTKLYSKWSNK